MEKKISDICHQGGGGVFFQNIEHIFCTPFLSPGKEFLRNNPTSSKHKYVIELVES